MTHVHPDDLRQRDLDEYEVTQTFLAVYIGQCTMDNQHPIRRNTRVGRVRMISNPLIPIPGVACADCVRLMPRAVR
jgi:hypothetical protein